MKEEYILTEDETYYSINIGGHDYLFDSSEEIADFINNSGLGERSSIRGLKGKGKCVVVAPPHILTYEITIIPKRYIKEI